MGKTNKSSIDGDSVGRDKIIYGDEVHGDKVGGNKITVDNITGDSPVNIAGGDINITQNLPPTSKPKQSITRNSKSSTTKKTSKKSDNKFVTHWLPIIAIIIAILGVIATVMVPEFRQWFGLEGGDFSYQVHVQRDGTGDIIKDARVTIEVAGSAPLIGYTDSNGLARIFIDVSYAEKPGRLRVDATGYEPYWKEMDISKGSLPDLIYLTPLP